MLYSKLECLYRTVALWSKQVRISYLISTSIMTVALQFTGILERQGDLSKNMLSAQYNSQSIPLKVTTFWFKGNKKVTNWLTPDYPLPNYMIINIPVILRMCHLCLINQHNELLDIFSSGLALKLTLIMIHLVYIIFHTHTFKLS